MKNAYRFETKELQDKLGVVEARINVELTPALIKRLAQRGMRFYISSNGELGITSDMSYKYDNTVTEAIRKAAIDKIIKEIKEVNTTTAEFNVKLDTSDIDFSEIDRAYEKELEEQRKYEQKKMMLEEIKTILRELKKQNLLAEFVESENAVRAELIDGTEIRVWLDTTEFSKVENIVQRLRNLKKEEILIRVIEKLKQEIKELKKEKEELREKILEEIANAGSFTIKKEREITYIVEEEDC